jgi:hypothetical protein
MWQVAYSDSPWPFQVDLRAGETAGETNSQFLEIG